MLAKMEKGNYSPIVLNSNNYEWGSEVQLSWKCSLSKSFSATGLLNQMGHKHTVWWGHFLILCTRTFCLFPLLFLLRVVRAETGCPDCTYVRKSGSPNDCQPNMLKCPLYIGYNINTCFSGTDLFVVCNPLNINVALKLLK